MSLLSSSLRGTSYLILLQAGSRILTFSLNQAILRYTTPSIFGFATIQLELLLSSILFLCREGFRTSIQRLPLDPEKSRVQAITNISIIPVTVGVFISSFLSWLYIARAPAESSSIPYFRGTVYLYALSTIIELFSEPWYNVALHKMLYRVRASCEGLAIFARCIVTFLVCVYGGAETGALAFACGQLAYSLVLCTAYYFSMKSMKSSTGRFWPTRLSDNTWFERSILTLSITNTAQGILKHILTEGDKFLISYFSSNEEQGTYGLAANYGGLIARIILQPIEEASRSYFSNLLPQAVTTGAQRDGKNKPGESDDEVQRMQENRATASKALTLILRLYLTFSLLLVAFAPGLMGRILPHFVSGHWSRITPVLAAYCYYIPLLAVNGILEAFVSATASTKVLRYQGLFWIPCSLLFGIAGVTFRHYRAQGLVYANCINLGVRICWATVYVINFFGEGIHYWDVMPSRYAITGILVLSSLTKTLLFNSDLFTSLVTMVCGIAALGSACFGEYRLLDPFTRASLLQRGHANKAKTQ